MVSNEAYQKAQERKLFLQKARTFKELTREAMTRVQFMKTRYKKAFDPDEEGYDYYHRSKRALSKLEYNLRQMKEAETAMELATSLDDTDGVKLADKKYESHMKNVTFYAFGIGQLYNGFTERAPVEALQ